MTKLIVEDNVNDQSLKDKLGMKYMNRTRNNVAKENLEMKWAEATKISMGIFII